VYPPIEFLALTNPHTAAGHFTTPSNLADVGSFRIFLMAVFVVRGLLVVVGVEKATARLRRDLGSDADFVWSLPNNDSGK
jgi:hypothetical protein